MQTYFGDVWLVRVLFQRGLGVIYAVAFLNVLNQFRPLLGEKGLLPVPSWLARVPFRQAPSVFHVHYSDRFLTIVAGVGLVLSIMATVGIADAGPIWLSVGIWLTLWALYLSIVNVGQSFYAFGWESMLLEAGFFAAFLGPTAIAPSLVPVLALRWMLFRLELGAGLIKIRGDGCWRDLTCLYYHYETQPMPNPSSAYFHRLPRYAHRLSVCFSHFVQLVAPFGLFAPQPVAAIAGCLIVAHQLLLIVSGNYAWLNWLTVVLGVTAFSDATLAPLIPLDAPTLAQRPLAWDVLLYALGAVTIALSIRPAQNLLSRRQSMNASYNPLHLVGSYGAFGSVTKDRNEIVLEGTEAPELTDDTLWREYEFKGKPGDPRRRPRQWAPYHLRLDWLMWFVPLSSVVVTGSDVIALGYERWFVRFVQKLLEADASILGLLQRDPFDGRRPTYVRANVYRYTMTDRRERQRNGTWWKRSLLGEYLPARPGERGARTRSHRADRRAGSASLGTSLVSEECDARVVHAARGAECPLIRGHSHRGLPAASSRCSPRPRRTIS
jgi:hypothetical protein